MPWRPAGSNWSECACQQINQQFKPTIVCCDIGFQPLRASNRRPPKFIAGIDRNHFKKQPLRAAVSIAKRMNNVELTVEVRHAGNKLFTRQANEIVLLFQLPEELVCFRLDSVDIRESCAAFADIDCAEVSSPVVYILKQMKVNFTQGRQGNIIEVRLKLLDSSLTEFDLGRLQGRPLGDAKFIDQHIRVWIAVSRIPSCAIFIGHALSWASLRVQQQAFQYPLGVEPNLRAEG
jgi:hypothetical protein